ncbi:MAG: 4-hydroxy-tetrahydrodipicolinate synthase [Clostridiales Family XIII bacterium]|nr:4-hydroxy-tetrahydrodipicolinate synthase [Clostridiales Family XIII bacterium]
MREAVFRGVATALITPFADDGIDYEDFGRLLDWQIEQEVDALVVCGTTGEPSTMTDLEHRQAIAYATEYVDGRVPVIAGVGSNETVYSVSLAKHAADCGADALLAVTPYYNKCTQKGLIKMFQTIADASTLPLILYNVPGRTGLNIEPETYEALAGHGNIAGIKEANSNIEKIMDTFARVYGKLDIYSGNDDQILPIMAMGGAGVISVISNILPREIHELTMTALRGDIAEAAALQRRYQPLIRALFSEVNPIPVKAAMYAMGYCSSVVRPPLTELEDDHRETLYNLMRREGLPV